MTCKVCGGELLFQDGKHICQSCGATFTLDSVYENVDVYICYEENDDAGRRTKDSMIAQEVYKKLEAAKLATFYERISAGSIAGDVLEAARYAAIQRAKAILLLGTSVKAFQSLTEKYGTYLDGKTVIPFCINVNPSAIPQSVSKTQAINYTTIGWGKDLINGLYNLLGKEIAVDTNTLYRRKKPLLVLGIISVLLLGLGIAAFFLLQRPNKNAEATHLETTMSTETTESAEKPLTPQELYNQAVFLVTQEKLIEALQLFLQIPDYPGSDNQIKLLYSKFEGYYKTDNVMLGLDITDNTQAEVSVTVLSDASTFSFVVTLPVNGDTVSGTYRSRNNQTGTVELTLIDTGVHLEYTVDGASTVTEAVFSLAEKSDEPLVVLDRETLLGWLDEGLSANEIRALGYDLEGVETQYLGEIVTYRIVNTDIYLTISSIHLGSESYLNYDFEDLIGIQAPASILTPSAIGQAATPYYEGDLYFWPDRGLIGSGDVLAYYKTSLSTGNSTITADMPIGVGAKMFIEEQDGYWGWERTINNSYYMDEILDLN